MMEQLTGPQLFLRYAWPCAEEKLKAGKISQGDFDQLKLDVEQNRHPNGWLLEFCFRNASRALHEFAGSKNPWSFETVQEFWLCHHIHKESPTVRGTVTGFLGRNQYDLFEVLLDENRTIPVTNLYDQTITLGDRVSIHHHSIIQVML
jgi:hypothetical protein